MRWPLLVEHKHICNAYTTTSTHRGEQAQRHPMSSASERTRLVHWRHFLFCLGVTVEFYLPPHTQKKQEKAEIFQLRECVKTTAPLKTSAIKRILFGRQEFQWKEDSREVSLGTWQSGGCLWMILNTTISISSVGRGRRERGVRWGGLIPWPVEGVSCQKGLKTQTGLSCPSSWRNPQMRCLWRDRFPWMDLLQMGLEKKKGMHRKTPDPRTFYWRLPPSMKKLFTQISAKGKKKTRTKDWKGVWTLTMFRKRTKSQL